MQYSREKYERIILGGALSLTVEKISLLGDTKVFPLSGTGKTN
jgi:hypothetical protein